MRIVIPGPPIPKARPRFFVRGKKVQSYDLQQREMKAVSDLMTYTTNLAFNSPEKQIVMEASNLAFAKELSVTLHFTLPLPKKLNRSEINAILWGFAENPSKPDVDNLVKFYLDCGNGVLWRDDSMITSLKASKCYGNKPQTVIDIMASKKSLSTQAKEILEELDPDEVLQMAEGSHELVSLIMALKQDSGDTSSEQYCGRVKLIASTLSRLADKYSRSLTRIHKKYPGFWQNGPLLERSSLPAS